MNRSQGKKDRSEVELLREAMAGRKEAYGQIFRIHRERAYGLAYQYTRNKEDALDIVQEAFIRAYTHLSRFDLGRNFGPWLLSIVRNLSIDCLRKRKRRATQELPQVIPDRKRKSADQKLLRQEVRAALFKMARPQREIIFLKDYQGHSYAEIAEIMEIPLGTVMSRLHHARKQLVKVLKA
ncbi:MAG: RNA polymerase sigma factor [Acidobacteriota bacterium]